MSKSVRAYGLLILLQSLFNGFGDVLSKFAYGVMPVFSLLSIRYCIGFSVMLLIWHKRIFAGLKKVSPGTLMLPALCIAANYLLNNAAMKLTSATSVALLRSTSIVMTPVLAAVLGHHRYRWQHIPIQIAILVGIYLLCGQGGLSAFGMGEILTLVSALLMAGALVSGRKVLSRVDAVTLSTVQAGTSFVMATVCAFLFDGGLNLHLVDIETGASIVYLGLMCTLMGYLLQNTALSKISARSVSLLQCTCPVMTALFSYLMLGERLGLAGVAGAAIILGGLVAENFVKEG